MVRARFRVRGYIILTEYQERKKTTFCMQVSSFV